MSVSTPGQQGTDRMGRGVCRARYASRGQALIMAVLIMFLIAGLAGLFIAMINQALVQSARAVDRAKLDEVALAGLHHVQKQLQYSIDGADWRPEAGPDQANRGWIYYAGAFYKINLSYGPRTEISATNPFRANPLDRLMKIDIEARFALDHSPQLDDMDNPAMPSYLTGYRNPKRFLTRKITAFMPSPLTDYVRWITNISGSTEPSVLGTGVTLPNLQTVKDPTLANSATNYTLTSAVCTSLFEGPVRCEGDLHVGDARFDLTNDDAQYAAQFQVSRQDLLEVVGALSAYENASASITVMVNNHNRAITNAAVDTQHRIDLRSYLNGGAVPLPVQYLQTRDNNPLIRPLQAPRIDERDPVTGVDRYRALTRDSAFYDFMASSAASATAYSTYMLGRGDGIYIDNHTDIQYKGDIDALRKEWLNPTDNTNTESCWDAESHRLYDPLGHGKAVELILGDWSAASGVVMAPMITMKWSSDKLFYDKDGNIISKQSIRIPYPRNGVIYAEGNVVVRGNLPASVAYQRDAFGAPQVLYDNSTPRNQMPGGWDRRTGNMRYYVSDVNRRFDLTIVSGGTVYIEGNLLTPASRKLTYKIDGTTNGGPITRGSEYDSKLALLAMDNVCLNPTRQSLEAQEEPQSSPGSEPYWRARVGMPINLTFSTAGPVSTSRPLNVLLRHAGALDLAQPDYAKMTMLVNNVPFWWDANASSTALGTQLYFYPTNTSTFIPTGSIRGGGLYNAEPFNLQTWNLSSLAQYSATVTSLPLYGYGATNTLTFYRQGDGTDYLLSAGQDIFGGVALTGIDLQVDALMYAQRGSWFIIPGRYYNEDSNLTNPDPLKPQYQEPLDIRIVINGAIVENHPAPPDAEEAWTQHWRGSNASYFTNSGSTPALEDPGNATWDDIEWRWQSSSLAFDRRMGIVYYYDATLARPVCFERDPDDSTIRYYSPRLPKLPVSPNVFSISALRGV